MVFLRLSQKKRNRIRSVDSVSLGLMVPRRSFYAFLNSFRSTGLIYYGDEARENEWFFDKITDEYPDLILRISRLKLKPHDDKSIPILLDMFMGAEAYYGFDETDLPPVLLCHWVAMQKDNDKLIV